ncbi:hypothetical protein BpHYR1_019227 [Brachionus plicatilis]|uniref:Uncharacterized protein n=1 Tax=Brachionus plicatilis TaxID=10195 RepID=A0A3M7QIB1_BRAPC|nr:hypothetical protein BpHYR1_019227 [Brachionus plicatilis]
MALPPIISGSISPPISPKEWKIGIGQAMILLCSTKPLNLVKKLGSKEITQKIVVKKAENFRKNKFQKLEYFNLFEKSKLKGLLSYGEIRLTLVIHMTKESSKSTVAGFISTTMTPMDEQARMVNASSGIFGRSTAIRSPFLKPLLNKF